MKKIVLLIFVSVGFINTTQAQIDYCKEIIKKLNQVTNRVEYSTPSMSRLDNIKIEKSTDSQGTAYLSLTFATTQTIANYDAKGVFVKFDDGTSVIIHGNVDCSYLNADDHYLYLAGHLMDDDSLLPFKTKKINKFIIDGKEVLLTDEFASKFKAWANCIETIK